jgi:hypothetical protein
MRGIPDEERSGKALKRVKAGIAGEATHGGMMIAGHGSYAA